MPINSAQILDLENPYEFFKYPDVLAEHQEELNTLKPSEMHALATKIMQNCPNEQLRSFGREVQSLKESGNPKPTFYHILNDAHQVQTRLNSIIDPKNAIPNLYFLGGEFAPEIFHDFPELSKNFFEKNKKALITLVMYTERDNLSALVNNIRTAFPKDKELQGKINGAATLRREILQHLLSDKPEVFFSSKEVNSDLCIEFSEILNKSIEGHEADIGMKLASHDVIHHEIHRTLEVINPSAQGVNNPLRKVAAAMSQEFEKDKSAAPAAITPAVKKESSEEYSSAEDNSDEDAVLSATTTSTDGKPSAAGMFSPNQLTLRAIATPAAVAAVPSPTAKPEKKDDNCCSRLFGF